MSTAQRLLLMAMQRQMKTTTKEAKGRKKRGTNDDEASGTQQGAGSKNNVDGGLDLSMQMPVQKNSVSKNGFFQSGKK